MIRYKPFFSFFTTDFTPTFNRFKSRIMKMGITTPSQRIRRAATCASDTQARELVNKGRCGKPTA